MHDELADHVSLLAAPIYAALLGVTLQQYGVNAPLDAGQYERMRDAAVYQAIMLRKLVLETPYSG